MQVKKGEIGEIIEGKITGITKYGAFVSLDRETSGMIHISEIAFDFIKDINEVLQINQTVKAVVIGANENGRLALSLKQMPKSSEPEQNKPDDKPKEPDKTSEAGRSFEDMMNKFKRDSDDKFSDLKFIEPKRSGQPRRRKD